MHGERANGERLIASGWRERERERAERHRESARQRAERKAEQSSAERRAEQSRAARASEQSRAEQSRERERANGEGLMASGWERLARVASPISGGVGAVRGQKDDTPITFVIDGNSYFI